MGVLKVCTSSVDSIAGWEVTPAVVVYARKLERTSELLSTSAMANVGRGCCQHKSSPDTGGSAQGVALQIMAAYNYKALVSLLSRYFSAPSSPQPRRYATPLTAALCVPAKQGTTDTLILFKFFSSFASVNYDCLLSIRKSWHKQHYY